MTIELNKEYQWNQHWPSRFANNTDINKVVAELKDIEDVHGLINAELIVESSKNKKSILHSWFEWDDAKAAHKFRIQKANELLGRIEVKVIKDGQPKILKAFEITKNDNFNSKSSYNAVDFSSSSSSRNKYICLENLNRVINRLEPYPEFKEAVILIKKAVKIISKDSTETEKEVTKSALSVAG